MFVIYNSEGQNQMYLFRYQQSVVEVKFYLLAMCF